MAKGYGDRSLQETPTWAVAAVCAVFVIVSIVIEHGIHSLGKVIHFHILVVIMLNQCLKKIAHS